MKTVLINGGSRGIGRAIVEKFSKEGYNVAFTYLNSEDEAEELSLATGALAIRADTRSESDVKRAVKIAADAFSGIDILVNNAGVSSFSLFTDITLEEWNGIFSVNVTGAFLYSKEVIPYMLRNKYGRIINISSMWGITGSSCEVHYSASKAALIGLTKALAKELGPSGITVNAIAPGLIDTDMNKAVDGETKRQIAEETPLLRMGRSKEVADAALFLASDGASFITGDVLNVSGGYVI